MLEISQLTGRNANDMMNSIFIESVGGIIASNYRLALICLSLGRNFNKEIDIFEFGNVSYFFYQKYKELYNNLINK